MALWRIALVSIKWIVREITRQISWVMSISLTDAVQNWLLSLTAYGWTEQNWTPTPDIPVDIVSNNGVIKFWEELFDINDSTTGYYYSAQGEYAVASAWRLTDFIPVQAWETYVFKYTAISSPNVRLNYFDTNKTWLSQTITSSSAWTYSYNITPSQDWYIRISANRANAGSASYIDWDTVQILAQRIYIDWTTETINAHGKNLYDGIITHFGFAPGAQQVSTNPNYRSIVVKVDGGKTYTFSRQTAIGNRFAYYFTIDKPAAGVSGTGFFSLSETLLTRTFTVPSGYNYVVMYFDVNGTDISGSQMMLELGSTATTYEPYFNGGTATAEMLLKVGNYVDEQEILSWNIIRNIGVKVFDGTERFAGGQASGVQCIQIAKSELGISSDTLPNNSLDLICTHYKAVNESDWEQTELNTIKVGSGYLFFNTQYVQDSTSFKAYLANQYAAGTPVIVVYPLATPTTETVTGQTMNIQAWNNTIEITQASIDDLELSAEYKALPSN